MKIKISILSEGLKEIGLNYEKGILEKFKEYKDLLIEWSKKINLTAIKEEKEIYIKHFLDSLIIVNEKEFINSKKVIDIGTGGGFPGLPLKIVKKDIEITLLDSLKKRIEFLQIVAEKLSLDQVKAIHGRAEDYGVDNLYREKYDLCVSRAVAQLNILAEYCLPFVKEGGHFIAYKSNNIDEEISGSKKAIDILGGKIKNIKSISIPNTEIVRKIVIIEKIEKTNKKYPRKAGKPSKKPL